MRSSPRCNDHRDAVSKRSRCVAALLILLGHAQGLKVWGTATSPSARGCSAGAPGGSSFVDCLGTRFVRSEPLRRRLRCSVFNSTGRILAAPWPRRRHCTASRLKMANPEGTQQMRDRDLEFMFYDEAQVRGPRRRALCIHSLLFEHWIPWVKTLWHGFDIECGSQSTGISLSASCAGESTPDEASC